MIKIAQSLIKEAYDYAVKSKAYTSNRHDFHGGGLDNKQKKMFEGKLGEKVFKQFLLWHQILFDEDHTDHTQADDYDFIVKGRTIDVKTRTQPFHTRTLEMVEQFYKKPKDIYVSVRLYPDRYEGEILGYIGRDRMQKINRIQNLGYLDNFVILDHELSDIDEVIEWG